MKHLNIWKYLKARQEDCLILLLREDFYFTYEADAEAVVNTTGTILHVDEDKTKSVAFPKSKADMFARDLTRSGLNPLLVDSPYEYISEYALTEAMKTEELRTYLETYPGSCLANGTPGSYARGYREGFLWAMQIVRDMISDEGKEG